MAQAIISAARLRELLHYDADTGVFTWQVRRGRTAKPGDIAGNWVDGYVKIMVCGKTHGAHRLAWLYVTGRWPETDMIDHKDGVRHNNRFSNLREVTRSVNAENQRAATSRNKLGFLGVSRHHRSERFRSSIRVDGKLHRLGWFDTPEEAHEAYLQAKRVMHAGCTI